MCQAFIVVSAFQEWHVHGSVMIIVHVVRDNNSVVQHHHENIIQSTKAISELLESFEDESSFQT